MSRADYHWLYYCIIIIWKEKILSHLFCYKSDFTDTRLNMIRRIVVNLNRDDVPQDPKMIVDRAQFGNLLGVQALIESRADINITRHGKTALIRACEGGFSTIVEALIEADCNLDARHVDGSKF